MAYSKKIGLKMQIRNNKVFVLYFFCTDQNDYLEVGSQRPINLISFIAESQVEAGTKCEANEKGFYICFVGLVE